VLSVVITATKQSTVQLIRKYDPLDPIVSGEVAEDVDKVIDVAAVAIKSLGSTASAGVAKNIKAKKAKKVFIV
jgi:hypothetical protein